MLTEEHSSKKMAASLENLCRFQDECKASLQEMKRLFAS
jgi:hypothetical protein